MAPLILQARQFVVIAPARTAAERLVKGPAYGEIGNREAEIAKRASRISNSKSQISDADWPTYRHDARRTGSAGCPVSPTVQAAWHVGLGLGGLLLGRRVTVEHADRQ